MSSAESWRKAKCHDSSFDLSAIAPSEYLRNPFRHLERIFVKQITPSTKKRESQQRMIDELYNIISLPKPKCHWTKLPQEEKVPKKKSKKNFFEKINFFSPDNRIRRDSTVTTCTMLSVK